MLEQEKFAPGERLNTLGLQCHVNISALDYVTSHHVKVPGRVGWSVCDMTRFNPGRPGGGGVGMAVGVYSYATVSLREGSADEILSKRPALIAHFIALFRKVTKYEGAFSVRAYSDMGSHVGLGSTSSIVLAVLHGMNECLGKPFKHEDLRRLLAYNYVEEEGDLLRYGWETGMTGLGAEGGGIFALSDHVIKLYQYSFAEGDDARVYVIFPDEVVSLSGVEENQMLEEGKVPDSTSAKEKAYIITMDLPAKLHEGNIVEVGKTIWQLQTCGSKTTEISKHGKNVADLLMELNNLQIGTVGMSSAGPAVALVTKEKREKIESIVKGHKCRIECETVVDNVGVTKKAYQPVDVVYVQGAPGSGKTTLCKKLAESGNLIYFSVGELIREKREKDPNSKEAKILARIQDTGEVADEGDITTLLVIGHIEKLIKPGKRNVFLLDGFPRTEKQIDAFESKIKLERKVVLHLRCSSEERLRRIRSRAQESGRADDVSKPLIEKRFAVDETDQIVARYPDTHTINAEKAPSEVFAEAVKIVSKL